MLAGLSLIALGLGFTLAPASASNDGNDDGCSGDVVVNMDAWVWSRPGHDTYQFGLSQPLEPGMWEVSAESHDAYKGRAKTNQHHEQWILQFLSGSKVVATVGPTTDIPDGTDRGASSDHFGPVVLSRPVDSLRVLHYLKSTKRGTDSVTADCVGLDLVGSLPPPSTTVPPPTTAAPPSTTVPPPTTAAPPSTNAGFTAPAVRGPIPVLRAGVDCRAGTIDATVVNDGDQPTAVDVFLVEQSVVTGVDLPVGGSSLVEFNLPPRSEGQVLRLVVSDPSGVVDTGKVLVNCERPADIRASLVVQCQDDTVQLTLFNAGQESSVVDVLVERSGRVGRPLITGGETVIVNIDISGRSEIPLRVVAPDGTDILRQVVPIDCPRPDLRVSADVSCATGEILVNIWNRGDAPGSFDAMIGTTSLDGLVTEPGSVLVVGSPYPTQASAVPIRLIAADGTELAARDVGIGCGSGSVPVRPLDSGAASPGPPGSTSPCSSVAVLVGENSVAKVATTPNPGSVWSVKVDGIGADMADGAVVASVRACAAPAAEFSVNCSADLVRINMSNSGSISTRLAVLVDGQPAIPGFDIAAGGTRIVSLDISEAHEVRVIEAGRAGSVASLIVSCSGGGAATTAAHAVFAVSILGTLLAVVDPRRLLLLVR